MIRNVIAQYLICTATNTISGTPLKKFKFTYFMVIILSRAELNWASLNHTK